MGSETRFGIPGEAPRGAQSAAALAKLAPTLLSASSVKVQSPEPWQAPFQLRKNWPSGAECVSAIFVPPSNCALQAPPALPQAMPAGAEVTEPVPLPLSETASVKRGGGGGGGGGGFLLKAAKM